MEKKPIRHLREESFSINLWGLKINCNNPGYKSIIILVIILLFFFLITKSINIQSLFSKYSGKLVFIRGMVKN